MDDYEYYGLFLTQESKDKLAKWLFFNEIYVLIRFHI